MELVNIKISIPPEMEKSVLDTVRGLAMLRSPRGAMMILGRTATNTLRDHFTERDKEPNKRGFKKTHFYGRLRNFCVWRNGVGFRRV